MKQKTRTVLAARSVALVLLLAPALPGLAATVVWNNTAGGNWSVATNWLPNTVPGPNDSALVTNPGTYTVTLDVSPTVGSLTLGGASGTQQLLMNGHTLSLNGAFTINANGSYSLNSGALVGITNAVVAGTFGWVAGSLGGILTLAPGSTMTISSANNHDMPNCTLTSNGTVAWSQGPIRGGGSGTVIYNYGLWNAQSDDNVNDAFGGAGVVFNNYDTFRKSGGANELSTATTFENGVVFNQLGGVLDVQNGTNGLEIAFQGGGNFTGGYITTNQFGLTVFSIGSFNLNGTITGTNTWQDAGNLVGNNVINGALTWVAGNWDGASVSVTGNSTLLVRGGGGNNDLESCNFTNYGTVTWASGSLRGGGDPATLVYNYGLWNVQSDEVFEDAFGGNGTVFNNYGTFRKSGGANGGATFFQNGVVFNQFGGVIDVQNGTDGLAVDFQGGGNFTGGYITTNRFGFTVFSIGSFNLNGTITGTNTWQDAGDLVGNNVISGALTWVAGNWDGANVTVTSNSTVIVAGGAGNNDLESCNFTNFGTVAWASGSLRGGGNPGTLVYNYGLWNAQSDQAFYDAFGGNGTVFNNYATFRKSAGTNSNQTLIGGGVPFNQLAGLVDVQQGNLVLQGSGNFSGGAVNGPGTTILSIGSFNIKGTLVPVASNFVENSGNLVGANVINGGLTWVAGNWDGANVTVTSNSTVIVAGGAGNNDLANCNFTNYGTVAWASGNLRGGGNPGTLVYNYGLWNAQSDEAFYDAFGGNGTVFDNYATFHKSAGASTNDTLFGGGVLLNQLAGLVDVQQGYLVLQGSGNFSGGSVSGPGTTILSIGSFNINGTLIPVASNFVENSGNLVGTNVINGGLTWVAGNWDGANVTVTSNSTVIVAGGAGNNDLANCNFTNYGTVAWASGNLRGGGNPGTLVYNYGLWNAQSDEAFYDAFGGDGTVFNNYATFRKLAGTSTNDTLFGGGVLLNQLAGLVDVQQGYLVLQGSGNFSGGSVSGPGTTILSIGSFNINGTVTPSPSNFVENSGSLVGTNVINGGLTWVAGTWDGANVTVANNSTVIVAGSGGDNDMASSSVTNYGTVTWSSGNIRGGGNPATLIWNFGLWDAQSDQQLNDAFGGTGTMFINSGTLRKELTTGATTFSSGVSLTNTGKMDAQSGVLSIQGAYKLANGSQMSFGLTSATNYGRIGLSGAASFFGSLSAIIKDPLYSPTPGTTFNLLSYTSEAGILFTNASLPAHINWITNYGATIFSLSVAGGTNPAPIGISFTTVNGTNLVLEWPTDHLGWRLQSQTNSPGVGLTTNWFTIPGSGLTNEITFPVDKTLGSVFYRMVYP